MNPKHKTCLHCTDRMVEPNCHMDCDGYLQRQSRAEYAREARRFDDKCTECVILGKLRVGKALRAGRIGR